MTGGATRVGWGVLIAAKAACCGVLLLFLTGVLSLNGVLGWFRGGYLAWPALAGAVVMAGVFPWLRRRRRHRSAAERRLRPVPDPHSDATLPAVLGVRRDGQ